MIRSLFIFTVRPLSLSSRIILWYFALNSVRLRIFILFIPSHFAICLFVSGGSVVSVPFIPEQPCHLINERGKNNESYRRRINRMMMMMMLVELVCQIQAGSFSPMHNRFLCYLCINDIFIFHFFSLWKMLC